MKKIYTDELEFLKIVKAVAIFCDKRILECHKKFLDIGCKESCLKALRNVDFYQANLTVFNAKILKIEELIKMHN